MKQSIKFHGVLVLLFLLISSFSKSDGRILLEKQGEDQHDDTNLINELPKTNLLELEEKDTWKLMGMEDCDESGDEKEEECLKRRMISEAHLDYIYTQHHKP
ncbi:hypothetical protein MKX01_022015 [Papaver californicum]|nr:hypothetical protein MKX01_022107 [Papaver californicum]KAI3997868.1 hypothetical protein MKX01_022015 [Papaver californicum]